MAVTIHHFCALFPHQFIRDSMSFQRSKETMEPQGLQPKLMEHNAPVPDDMRETFRSRRESMKTLRKDNASKFMQRLQTPDNLDAIYPIKNDKDIFQTPNQ